MPFTRSPAHLLNCWLAHLWFKAIIKFKGTDNHIRLKLFLFVTAATVCCRSGRSYLQWFSLAARSAIFSYKYPSVTVFSQFPVSFSTRCLPFAHLDFIAVCYLPFITSESCCEASVAVVRFTCANGVLVAVPLLLWRIISARSDHYLFVFHYGHGVFWMH